MRLRGRIRTKKRAPWVSERSLLLNLREPLRLHRVTDPKGPSVVEADDVGMIDSLIPAARDSASDERQQYSIERVTRPLLTARHSLTAESHYTLGSQLSARFSDRYGILELPPDIRSGPLQQVPLTLPLYHKADLPQLPHPRNGSSSLPQSIPLLPAPRPPRPPLHPHIYQPPSHRPMTMTSPASRTDYTAPCNSSPQNTSPPP